MFRPISLRLVALLALLPLLFFCLPAQAQVAPAWDGYDVIARDGDGLLDAAVVRDTDTGGLTLLIGTVRDGGFTLAVRAEHAVPASWEAAGIDVIVSGDGETPVDSAVTVRVQPDNAGNMRYLNIVLREDGWQVVHLRGCIAETANTVMRMADGEWLAAVYAIERTALLPASAISGTPEDFDFDQTIAAGAAAIAAKYAQQSADVQAMLQAAFPGTALVDGAPITWDFQYDGERLTAAAAAVRTDGQTALCLWTRGEGDAWEPLVNWHTLSPDAALGSLYLSLSYGDSGDALQLAVHDHGAAGMPEIHFQLNADGGWRARYYGVNNEDGDFWSAEINDGVMRIYAGGFIAEEGYLYADEDPRITAFEAFSPEGLYAAMRASYDAFIAGEPPLIPDDDTAYALPQPCGAALKKGTYAVYSGPGKQYYREAGGKAAVSSGDWVQVFGTDGKWVLVQYRIDGPLLRFGYIQTSALKNPAEVPALTLESVPLTDLSNEFVTSNPLGLDGRIRLPSRGWDMTRLGTLGDYWMYVELTMPDGTPARMFAEVHATHG